jgi:crossover junction endodeoxyribonuclease RusA
VIEFEVFGEPRPQGSMRAISVNGRARVFHDSDKRLRAWRQLVAQAATDALDGHQGYDEPVSVFAEFRLSRPVSKPMRVDHPSWKPDLDKLVRAVLDALEASGAVANDSRVVAVNARKVYARDDQGPGLHLAVVSEREGELDDGETRH